MGRLFLVRHGQASALSGDYDQLSTLGREQSRLLAGHFERFQIVPDRVLVGPRRRHVQTHAEALSALTLRDRWPAPEHAPELDEHHAVQLVVHLGPAFHAREDDLGTLARAAYGGEGDIKRAMGKLFAHVIPAWVRGKWCFADAFDRFHEKNCRNGSLGTLASKDLIGVLLANAGRLDKYGA